jgi:hypothetical protein
VQARVVTGEVAAAVAHGIEQLFAAGFDLDARADGIAVALRAVKFQTNPGIRIRRDVAEQQRLAGDGQDGYVDPAVVVEIAAAPPRYELSGAEAGKRYASANSPPWLRKTTKGWK